MAHYDPCFDATTTTTTTTTNFIAKFQVAKGNVIEISSYDLPDYLMGLFQLKKYETGDNKSATSADDYVFSFERFVDQMTDLGLRQPTVPRFPIFEQYVRLSFSKIYSIFDFLVKYPSGSKRYAALKALGIFATEFKDEYLVEQLGIMVTSYMTLCKRNPNFIRNYETDYKPVMRDHEYEAIKPCLVTIFPSINRDNYDNFSQVVLFQSIDSEIARFISEFYDSEDLVLFLK